MIPVEVYYKVTCAHCGHGLLWIAEPGVHYSDLSQAECAVCKKMTSAKGAQQISDLLAAVLLAQGSSTS